MPTFWALLFGSNEIKFLVNVKSLNVVFFAEDVVISGRFVTTRVVRAQSGDFARSAPVNTRQAGIAALQVAEYGAPRRSCRVDRRLRIAKARLLRIPDFYQRSSPPGERKRKTT